MLLNCPTKMLRAKRIDWYVRARGLPGVVMFTCGNAAQALRDLYRDGGPPYELVEIGPRGDLLPGRWWTPLEIARTFPHLFDATPGHLPAWMMVEMADAMRRQVGPLTCGATYDVPSGSCETITCLRWAYPSSVFRPVFDVPGLEAATARDARAPLYAAAVCDWRGL